MVCLPSYFLRLTFPPSIHAAPHPIEVFLKIGAFGVPVVKELLVIHGVLVLPALSATQDGVPWHILPTKLVGNTSQFVHVQEALGVPHRGKAKEASLLLIHQDHLELVWAKDVGHTWLSLGDRDESSRGLTPEKEGVGQFSFM